jgi:N-methylhydantoinase A
VLSFDMGGTTAKAGTIIGGAPEIAYEFEAAGATHSGRASPGQRISGALSVRRSRRGERGRRNDRAGSTRRALRVGPLSAGADPGPACTVAATRRR